MTQHTLEQLVDPQKAALAARTVLHEEAVALLADVRSITSDDPAFGSAQRQLPDAQLAESVTRADREDARRTLIAAYEAARQQILEERRPELAARVQRVNKALGALVTAVVDLDAYRATLTDDLGGASERVPIVSPLPYAKDRSEAWRAAMRSENLL